MDDLAGSNRDRPPENRTIANKSVKFAVFAAGVRVSWKIAEKRIVEFASGKAAIENLGINANGDGAETARLKEADEFVRVSLPDGKQSAHSDARKIFFAIGAQVFEENVAKGNLANALIVETAQGLPHARFINGIRALRRDAHFVERQADGCGLELEKLAANAVHADAFVALGDGREEGCDVELLLLEQRVKRHGAVFAAAPAEEDGFAYGHKRFQ